VAIDTTKIHVGTARIFVGVTPPATGTPPTWLTHTAGVPATGTDIGATDGDCVFKYQLTKQEIFAEQELAPVDVYSSDEACSLVFTLKELNYTALKVAFDSGTSSGIGNVDDGTRTGFYGGGGSAILLPTQQCFVFSAMNRVAPTKFIIGVIYKAYSLLGTEAPIRKKGETMIKCELHGLADLTRNAGDRMFQLSREK